MTARIKPNKVRNRQLEEIRGVDPDGKIVIHHRLVDTLGRMLKSGSIDPAMHDAGRDFQAAFILAQLDPLRALPILRVPGTGREPDLNERQLHARRRVQEALQALGGHGSPTGSWAWHVLGCQRSIREWAIRQGWGGRPLHYSKRRASRWPRWISSRSTSATVALPLEVIGFRRGLCNKPSSCSTARTIKSNSLSKSARSPATVAPCADYDGVAYYRDHW